MGDDEPDFSAKADWVYGCAALHAVAASLFPSIWEEKKEIGGQVDSTSVYREPLRAHLWTGQWTRNTTETGRNPQRGFRLA